MRDDPLTHFPNPHSRYQHIFVVVRLEKPDSRGREGPLNEEDITLTKAFLTERAAQEEADRMNVLNGKYSNYSINVARLVEDPKQEDEDESEGNGHGSTR